ncbi:uncharacterized protein [Palaemon carinicauda]
MKMDTKESEMISSIRQKARQSGQAFRVKRRKELHASHRHALDKVAEELQIPDIDEVYKLSIQLKKKKSLHILHKLRMGLSVGGNSITVFVSTDGALYALVSCFSGNSAEVKREAMNVFINLGLGTPEQCLDLYKRFSVYLMIHMNGRCAESQDAVAWCLGNLCLNNEELCYEMKLLGVDGHLTELLGCHVCRTVQSASYALTHYYATVPDMLQYVRVDNIARKAIDGLERHDDGVDEIAWLMFVLSCDQLGCEYLLCLGVIPAAMGSLQKLINQQNLLVSPTTGLLRVLLNCLGAFPRSAHQVCNRSEQFVSICSALLYSSYPHLRRETLQFIANIINGACQSESGQRFVEEHNLRQKLEAAVRSALAANFTLDSPTISTNFSEGM